MLSPVTWSGMASVMLHSLAYIDRDYGEAVALEVYQAAAQLAQAQGVEGVEGWPPVCFHDKRTGNNQKSERSRRNSALFVNVDSLQLWFSNFQE